MAGRSKAREQIVQLLYMIEQSKLTQEDAVDFFIKNFEVHEEEMPFIRSRLTGIVTELLKIDEKIAKYSEHWKMNRMPKVDRNILRLGAYELEFCLDVPVSVVINEAIELGKKFGDINTPKFVNGILDKIAKEIGRTAA
jgi:N utilization substance protein B